jgi:hypothetical protein
LSKETIGLEPSSMSRDEAEEFMALLLKAQGSQHKCPWCDYFKKIGARMIKVRFPEEGA